VQQEPNQSKLSSPTRAVAPAGDSLEALLARAEIATQKGGDSAGLDVYRAWLARNPNVLGAHFVWFNLGTLLSKLQRADPAEAAYRAAIELEPTFTQAWINLGLQLEKRGQIDEAVAAWTTAREIARRPEQTASGMEKLALNHLGRALDAQHRFEEAHDALVASLAVEPEQYDVIQTLVRIRQRQCQWPVWKAFPGAGANQMLLGTSPMAMLGLADDPALQLLAAKTFVDRTYSELIRSVAPLSKRSDIRQRKQKDRIRIGYVSGDLCMHPVGLLLPDLIAAHDRSRFEVFAYCWSPEDGSPQRARVRSAFDHFRIVKGQSDQDAANLIYEDAIDLLIDLQGVSAGARPGILARRPAPIQITWLGIIGTTALPWIDYLIADDYCIKEGDEIFYTEKLLKMPTVFQPGDTGRIIGLTPSRSKVGLPDSAFVFASFNNSYKLNPEVLASWGRILEKVPDSVLWLLDDNPAATANVVEFLVSRDINRSRIIFAPRVSHADYLARMPLADLFLDAFPYNAGATAADSLWMGLPLLTLRGRTFVARMAASLNAAAGNAELITYSKTEYEERAIQIARKGRLSLPDQVHERQRRARQSPLFRPARFASELEALLLSILNKPAQH
jgi:predicted O-linked N-acetylglucosamine transferase (SPINDLY family)